MKKLLLATIIIAASVFFASTAEEKQSGNLSSSLIGTWELASIKYGDATEFTDAPKEVRAMKFVNGTHFIWVRLDAKKKITLSLGGTYKVNGDKYAEKPEFSLGDGMEEYVDKEQSFTLKVDGDKWTHSGTLSDGTKLSEIWRRVK